MLFPQFHIDAIKRDEQRDLQRFDLDFDTARPLPARVPGPDLPDHADRPRRRLAGEARHPRQLLRAVQRDPQPEAARRPAPAADAVPAAAVQPGRGPPHGAAEPRRRLLRLPFERPHQRVHAPDRRHPAPGEPPPHRHAEPARGQHPAPVRLAAGAEDGGGLHRVRAARRLLRRRPGDRDQEGHQPAGARQPGPPHGRVPGAARLPARAEAVGGGRQARSAAGQPGRAAGAGGVLRQGPLRDLPRPAVLHRQPDAQPADWSASSRRS